MTFELLDKNKPISWCKSNNIVTGVCHQIAQLVDFLSDGSRVCVGRRYGVRRCPVLARDEAAL